MHSHSAVIAMSYRSLIMSKVFARWQHYPFNCTW